MGHYVSKCVGARITHSHLKLAIFVSTTEVETSGIHTEKNTIWTVSQHCLRAYHRYWQGEILAGCRAQSMSLRLIVRPGIDGAAKEK